MVKPYLSIKLKDPQNYYLEDEIIHCTGNLKLDKVLKDAVLYISFKGRASSHSNGTRHHYETIFNSEKEVPIIKLNTASQLKKMMEFDFEVQVPNGVTIPSFKNLEGGEGGKIEYMIEATLESAGFLKRSVQATHIIQVPLVGNINVNEDGLDRTKESSIRWPKNEETGNTCILSAWISHQGCIRGKDVAVRVELKQPKRYNPADYILFELVRQEIIASGRDSLPDMTKQLDDKIIQSEKIDLNLTPDIGDHRLIGMSQVAVVPISSNITPTIKANAKVMRLDYKIRVTAKMSGIDSGKDRVLSVNLPIVIGTTGVSAIYDSGFEFNMSNLNLENNNGSDSGHSRYSITPGSSFHGAYMHGRPGPSPPPPPMAGPGGFHMPNYAYPQQPYNMYPPPMHNQFVVNAHHVPYPPVNQHDSYEGMPMPAFNDAPYPPNHNGNEAPYPPQMSGIEAPYPPQMNGNEAPYPPHINGNEAPYPPHMNGNEAPYPPNNMSNEVLSPGGILSEGNQSGFGYPPVSSGATTRYGTPHEPADFSVPTSPVYPANRDKASTVSSEDRTIEEITLALGELSPTSSIKHRHHELTPPVMSSNLVGKPNTPTPPQTPGQPNTGYSAGWYETKEFTTKSCEREPSYPPPSQDINPEISTVSTGWYENKRYEAVPHLSDNEEPTKPIVMKKQSLKIPFRIDPLDSLAIASYPPPMYKNNSTPTQQQ